MIIDPFAFGLGLIGGIAFVIAICLVYEAQHDNEDY